MNSLFFITQSDLLRETRTSLADPGLKNGLKEMKNTPPPPLLLLSFRDDFRSFTNALLNFSSQLLIGEFASSPHPLGFPVACHGFRHFSVTSNPINVFSCFKPISSLESNPPQLIVYLL